MQGPGLVVLHAQNVWKNIHGGVLGYRLPRAAFPHFRCLEVKSGLISLQYTRRYERLALNDHDSSSARSDRSIYIPLRDLGTLLRWPFGLTLCVHMPR